MIGSPDPTQAHHCNIRPPPPRVSEHLMVTGEWGMDDDGQHHNIMLSDPHWVISPGPGPKLSPAPALASCLLIAGGNMWPIVCQK